MNTTTKDGIEVKPGQIWRDLDKRMEGRRVKVLSLGTHRYGGPRPTARVARCLPNGALMAGPRQSTLSIDRMHKHSTGWELASQSKA